MNIIYRTLSDPSVLSRVFHPTLMVQPTGHTDKLYLCCSYVPNKYNNNQEITTIVNGTTNKNKIKSTCNKGQQKNTHKKKKKSNASEAKHRNIYNTK